jgi:hypothetical protein
MMASQGLGGDALPPRRPRVRLAGDDPSHGGWLEVEARNIHGESVELSVWLTARLVWILAALAAARDDDERHDVPEDAAGWRRPDKLAAWIGQSTGGIPEDQSIRAYIYKICKSLRTEARRKYVEEVPVLIERRNGRGARIATGTLDFLPPFTPGSPWLS